MKKELIAPCGMNCGICSHYLRKENRCPGCFYGRKVNGRLTKCAIHDCGERKGEYCFSCEKFPCERLKRIDKRYRERYGMSEIENLKNIEEKGMGAFLHAEQKKWVTKEGTFCIHDKKFY